MAATTMPLWGCAAASNAANRDKTTREWKETLANIERTAKGRLGVAMLDAGSGLQLGWRQDERFAMASTFKAVLAGWMLALVDQGKERLDARVHFAKADVVAYSPVSGPRAGDGGGLTVGELCSATVSLRPPPTCCWGATAARRGSRPLCDHWATASHGWTAPSPR